MSLLKGAGAEGGPRWLEVLVRVNSLVAAALFAALTLVVALQVLTRFVLHIPFIWSEEVARFLFFWVVLLGSAMSVKSRRHFVIDVTGERLRRGRLGTVLFDVVPDVFVIAFSVFLLVVGAGYTEVGLLRTATNSGVNMALVYGAIPVFALLAIIYSVGNLLLDRRALAEGKGAEARTPPPGGE